MIVVSIPGSLLAQEALPTGGDLADTSQEVGWATASPHAGDADPITAPNADAVALEATTSSAPTPAASSAPA
ncbi:MAG: hypothetical protein J0L92_17750, partial [Deltaproteobacteria bacterium]|nr:hypothetical protein [Deltaproteobacteria bacterium]